MEDVVAEAGRPLFRLCYYLFRGLLWLAWDLSIKIIAWSIGWGMLRFITVGRYPKHKFSEQNKASFWQAVFIEFIGLGLLGLVVLSFSNLAFH
ncbi:hypothetical protein [Colwellia piezophila]|uniref:hypothetical protein n=1 Tax=Colwellia piezophila TaxID=211668 RepID=UPI00037DAA0F|nr:hypothetical protein [Colwellia piezophila]